MKNIPSLSLLFSSLVSPLIAIDFPKTEDITYEWLFEEGKRHHWTDHISCFDALFKHVKVKNFLEFGLGFSTKYFLDHCQKVISIEFITEGCGPDWIQACLNAYAEFPHWLPIAYFSHFSQDTSWAPYPYFGSEQIYIAGSYQCRFHSPYSLIDDSYLQELNTFLIQLMECHTVDCAFVDSNLYLRGDLVSLLFHKVPIIVAHDTSWRQLKKPDDVYGYSRVITPIDYEEIAILEGEGTTIWIQKDPSFEVLISSMQAYALRINS